MKMTPVGAVMCAAMLLAAGYASANSALGQLPGNDSAEASVPTVPAAARAAGRIRIKTNAPVATNTEDSAELITLEHLYRGLETELSTNYNGLMKELEPEAAASLRTAQKSWLAYRAASGNFAVKFYSIEKMVPLAVSNIRILRDRVLTLQSYRSFYGGSSNPGLDKRDHPIDAALDACIAKDPSTAGMINCISQASGKWDAELNKWYGALKCNVSPAKADSLKTAQRAWLTFRDAELKAIGGIYGGLQGTMYRPLSAYASMNVTRQRTLILLDYLGEIGIGYNE